MARYETRKALLEEIGRKAREVASHYLNWPPDYDEADLKEIWQNIREGKTDVRRVHSATQRATMKPPPAYTTLSAKNIKRLEMFAMWAKTALGLKEPIPVHELGEVLRRIKKKQPVRAKGYPVTLQYPLHYIDAYEGLHISYVAAVNFTIADTASETDYQVFVLQLGTLGVSLLTDAHPALCLAFLLSDIPIYQHTVDVIIDPFHHVNIYVRGPTTPMWLVGTMYQMAREVLFSSERKRVVSHPKPRAKSERALALVDFVNSTKDLSWKQRWEKWNNGYADWKYNSENSMRVVYYRTTKTKRR